MLETITQIISWIILLSVVGTGWYIIYKIHKTIIPALNDIPSRVELYMRTVDSIKHHASTTGSMAQEKKCCSKVEKSKKTDRTKRVEAKAKAITRKGTNDT